MSRGLGLRRTFVKSLNLPACFQRVVLPHLWRALFIAVTREVLLVTFFNEITDHKLPACLRPQATSAARWINLRLGSWRQFSASAAVSSQKHSPSRSGSSLQRGWQLAWPCFSTYCACGHTFMSQILSMTKGIITAWWSWCGEQLHKHKINKHSWCTSQAFAVSFLYCSFWDAPDHS